jgi:hypothetical protein
MADYNSSLPVRTEANGDIKNTIAGGVTNTNLAEVNATNELLVKDADVETAVGGVSTALTDGSQVTKVTDGTDNLEVNTDGSINVAFAAGAEIKITDGTDDLEINSDGSINVVVQESALAAELHVYDDATAGVPNTPTTVIDYTVPVTNQLLLKTVQGACSGKAKIEVKTGASGSEVLQAVAFLTSAQGSVELTFPTPIEVVAGHKVLVVITNRDNANADLYAFINGALV